ANSFLFSCHETPAIPGSGISVSTAAATASAAPASTTAAAARGTGPLAAAGDGRQGSFQVRQGGSFEGDQSEQADAQSELGGGEPGGFSIERTHAPMARLQFGQQCVPAP